MCKLACLAFIRRLFVFSLAVLFCKCFMTLVKYKIRPQIAYQTGALEALVGNTPLLPLQKVTSGLSPRVKVFAKAEWFNPGGSIKDRPALNIIRTALERGELTPGKRLLDSTSGNMGIAYATFGASLDVPVTLILPANASPERIMMLRALGAELILTDPLEGSDGALLAARRLAARYPERYFYANQYDNPANWQAHYRTTGPEIIAQTGGKVTHFVAGLGTSGTLTGVGRALREFNPAVRLIAVQPDASFHGLEGLKHMPTAIQPKIYDPTLPDAIVEVETEAAHAMVRRLARQEGLFAGISSGAAAVAALQVAQELDEGVVVTVFPDSGYKYLSDKNLWENE
jgi:cysteine synthase B